MSTRTRRGSKGGGPGDAEVLDLYRNVSRIRALELLLNHHIAEHGFGGFWHPGLGQEGIQAGAVSALREDDYLFYAHRGLGYALAKGMSPVTLLADLFGRTGGSVGGKGGGTIHFVDPELGVMGQGGTVGSSFVLGAGVGISAQMLGTDRVVAIFFGDGTSARGTWHEAALPASVWKLPLVWICENNGWAVSVPISEQSPTENIADRAAAYGVPGVIVDGQDTLAVREATVEAVARARAGEGPTLIEAKTLRVRGHYEGDKQSYREDLVDGLDVPNDPLKVLRERVAAEEADRIDEESKAEAEAALEEVLAMPAGGEDVVTQGVWVED